VSLAEFVIALLWIGLTFYAVFGGADFGAGFWDLTAGSTEKGQPIRALAAHSIGPVWEANHVWLIFVLVVLWTGFPFTFASVMSGLYIPLTAAAIGVILRGSGFAFRKAVTGAQAERAFGATFALSSVITPFFLGTVAGGIASERVKPGNSFGNAINSWWNPTSVLGGTLAVASCAFLAAVFLCADAYRDNEQGLVRAFQRRAIGAGTACGVIALAGIAILHSDAPYLYHGLTHRGLPLVLISAASGILTIALIVRRSFALARVTAVGAVVAVLWGWAAGQYPRVLGPTLTIEDAAGAHDTLVALVVAIFAGAVVLAPSLFWLLRLAQRGELSPD